MAKRRKNSGEELVSTDGANAAVSEQQLLNNLLALAVVQNLQQTSAIVKLAAAGMSYQRIAALLGTTYDTARVTVNQYRQSRKSRSK